MPRSRAWPRWIRARAEVYSPASMEPDSSIEDLVSSARGPDSLVPGVGDRVLGMGIGVLSKASMDLDMGLALMDRGAGTRMGTGVPSPASMDPGSGVWDLGMGTGIRGLA